MNDASSDIRKLLLSDPHWLKLLNEGEDGAAEPAGVFAVSRGFHLGAHRRRCQCLDLFTHAVFHSEEHCAATGKYDVLEQVLFDVGVAFEDSVVGPSLDRLDLLADEVGLEEEVGSAD